MRKQIATLACLFILFVAVNANAQTDKSKRLSPPDKVTETIKSGVTVSIDYSQPSIKGRSIGNEIAPYGKVWRTGANEATVFEINKDVKINGKPLSAGKYGLYSIPGQKEWTIIFNKVWNQSVAKYTEVEDALRITVNAMTAKDFTEKMTFKIEKSGEVKLMWGNVVVPFTVK
ncbi:MAG TPA: DUF2911 domain-containing protein [Pelobium sp.]|nr:DUF2911 domain-containing protein [Pelobium sp.]